MARIRLGVWLLFRDSVCWDFVDSRGGDHLADILKLVDDKASDLIRIADAIWDFAELGFREVRSAKIQADYLEEQGFRVTREAGGIPTAFVAEWGDGGPYIGFLGEYDACRRIPGSIG